MTFERIALEMINTTALRLVTFASQSVALAFVRDALGSQPDGNGLLAAVRTDNAGIAALKQAVCRAADMPRTVAHEKGETYKLTRGDNAGKSKTANATTYKPYTTAEYNEACKRLALAIERDETTVVTETRDNGSVRTIASYALTTTAS